jgi:hypothetical protein
VVEPGVRRFGGEGRDTLPVRLGFFQSALDAFGAAEAAGLRRMSEYQYSHARVIQGDGQGDAFAGFCSRRIGTQHCRLPGVFRVEEVLGGVHAGFFVKVPRDMGAVRFGRPHPQPDRPPQPGPRPGVLNPYHQHTRRGIRRNEGRNAGVHLPGLLFPFGKPETVGYHHGAVSGERRNVLPPGSDDKAFVRSAGQRIALPAGQGVLPGVAVPGVQRPPFADDGSQPAAVQALAPGIRGVYVIGGKPD